MPIYTDISGSKIEINSVYVKDDSVFSQIGKIYDYNGTNFNEIYAAEIVLVGSEAENSEISNIANWSNVNRVVSRRISTSELYFNGGGNASQGAIQCTKPLPKGYSNIEICIAVSECYQGYTCVRIGTTCGTDNIFSKASSTGTFNIAINPTLSYYLSLYATNVYTPDGTIQITKLRLY